MPHSRVSRRSAAAASAEPPPMPEATGKFLLRCKRAPASTPRHASRSASAAVDDQIVAGRQPVRKRPADLQATARQPPPPRAGRRRCRRRTWSPAHAARRASLPRTCSARLSLAGAGSDSAHQGAAVAAVRPASILASMPGLRLVLGGDQRRLPREARLDPPTRRCKAHRRDARGSRPAPDRPAAAAGQRRDRLGKPAALVQRPAERIGDRGVVGPQRAGLADHRFGRVEILAALQLAVAKEVEQQRIVRLQLQRQLQLGLGFGPAVGLLEAGARSRRSVHSDSSDRAAVGELIASP